MDYHLVCTREFHDRVGNRTYRVGDVETDQGTIDRLTDDREHHFVRVPTPVFQNTERPKA